MKWTGLNELREKYLSFFESKGHLRLPSFSLVPNNDKSLLLINSGMAPMKKYFTGEITPPRKRVTTCQKCIRTPDIERVGITARHGTYFEMLGNFSFGDYFKHEATAWAWEFFTKVLEIPAELLYCSIYEEDDEAFEIWTKEIGVEPSHIVRLGKADNFWEHGSGPCGPCSEIYFDRGEKYGCGSPDCAVGCECDRFIEVWNLVFTQFDNDGNNNYTPLANPNIDTGMGLERLACVMQGVDNLFLVDTMQNIMNHISDISGVKYGEGEKTDISLRVITDHIRSTTFMIGDGVMPSNEGRGYVLRRLLRRAARHGKLLGIEKTFLSDVAQTVIDENKTAYPELEDKSETIKKIINFEEESFYKTIDQGLALLNSFIHHSESNIFSGDDAFKLNDTYGFPIDLTKEILAEKGMTVDEDKFKSLLLEQRERARNARKSSDGESWASGDTALDGLSSTEFFGYESLKAESKVLAIVKNGEKVQTADSGDKVIIVLDKTPFYAESGGQVGDKGIFECKSGMVDITDTTKNGSGLYLHKAVVSAGSISEGDVVSAEVSIIDRRAIMRNHTAAHLLQAALRKVLGTHVEQAGQLVNSNHLRFDFTHFSALTPGEILEVEMLVNTQIMNSIAVDSREMSIEDAKKLGAMALFGEKYGDTVRVVSAGEFSREFCGGTHVDNTAKLGLFKITGESSAAAGIRRIEAVTGMNVYKMIAKLENIISMTGTALKTNNFAELPNRATQVVNELQTTQKSLETANSKLAANNVQGLFANAVEVKGVKVITAMFSGAEASSLRSMCDKVKDFAGNDKAFISVFAGVTDGKVSFAAGATPAAVKLGAKAGNVVKAVAQITGGNGGGKPDFAMAGGKDSTKVDEALDAVAGILEAMI